MKNLFILLLTGCLSGAYGQAPSHKNSVRVGVDYMSLDAPDALGFRYNLRYARHFGKDRVVVAATAGYLRTENQQNVVNNLSIAGNDRERLTADLTILFDFLGNDHHALRLGGGPSAWYRRDDRLIRSGAFVDVLTGEATLYLTQREQINALNLGWHLTAEYDYAIKPAVTLGGRIMVAKLTNAGISSIAGLSVGYRF